MRVEFTEPHYKIPKVVRIKGSSTFDQVTAALYTQTERTGGIDDRCVSIARITKDSRNKLWDADAYPWGDGPLRIVSKAPLDVAKQRVEEWLLAKVGEDGKLRGA